MMIITLSCGQIKPQLLVFSSYSIKSSSIIEMFIISIFIFYPYHPFYGARSLLHVCLRHKITVSAPAGTDTVIYAL